MKRCYYEILDVEKKATTSEIKSVRLYLFRRIEKWLWSIILIKIHPKKGKNFSCKFKRRMMFYQIPMKELFMTTIVKRFFSIKTKCQKKISNSIVLASIFGSTLRSDALKDITTTKDLFITFIETYSKKSKLKKLKHLSQETI